MSMDNVSLIPVWKEGPSATAADRLRELALIAEKNPEWFDAFVVVRQGVLLEDDTRSYVVYSYGEAYENFALRIGLLQVGILKTYARGAGEDEDEE